MAGAFTLQGFESPEEVQARIGKTRQSSFAAPAGGLGGALYQTAAQGNAGIGSAVAGALGYEDPAVKKSRSIQEMMKDLDPTTSEGLAAGSKRLREAGMVAEAAAVDEKYTEMRKLEASEIPTAKDPKTRNIGEQLGDKSYIVNQEYDRSTKTWREVGRRETGKGQTFNLSRTPVEKAAGNAYENALDAADVAESQLFTVNKARVLLPDIETGKLEGIVTWARQWGDAVGVPIDEVKMNSAVGFRSVFKNAVLDQMRKVKGPATDRDAKIIEDSMATLDNPMAANKFLIDTTESLAKRDIEKAAFFEDFASKNENSLIGARRAWGKRIVNVPLIKLVNKRPQHYYQYKEKAIKANGAYFKKQGWDESQINQAVDNLWVKEGK